VNLTHQGNTIFATWFTYDANHNPLWYSVTATQTARNTFSGSLIQTSGPAFNAVPFDPTQVQRTTVGVATLIFVDGNTGTFAYTVNGVTQTKNITRTLFQPPAGTICGTGAVPLIGRYRVATRGLTVQIETRGWGSGYWPGQVMREFDTFDSVVGTTVGAEVSLQFGVMKSMGINTITIELRSTDLGDQKFTFPTCSVSWPLGFQWPQPTAVELSGLRKFFDLAASAGIKIQLMLNNTHMDDIPNSQTWLQAILGVVGSHSALDVVTFGGELHVVDTNGDGIPDSCGGQAEAPLWLGPTVPQGKYVQWAIGYGLSLGIASKKLSAEAIVGNYFTDSQPPNQFTTDGHMWAPITTLKMIFDNLGIPANQRTYVISFYEHRKCSTAQGLSCVDADPHTWADLVDGKIWCGWGFVLALGQY
jgi:hypothetical protein